MNQRKTAAFLVSFALAAVCGASAWAESVCVTNRFPTGASLVVRGERGQTPAPVLVWFHGGGLSSGRGHFISLTDPGIMQVAVDYRLMQKDGSVRAEDCIDDAAQAVAWTLENAASFGGDPKKVFVSGHSAGGYLTMMVGMDPRWLAKTGHRIDELAGLIPVSGQATKHFNVRKYAGDNDAQYLPKIDDLAPLAHVDPLRLRTAAVRVAVPRRGEPADDRVPRDARTQAGLVRRGARLQSRDGGSGRLSVHLRFHPRQVRAGDAQVRNSRGSRTWTSRHR